MQPEEDSIWIQELKRPDNRVAWVRFFHWIEARVLGLARRRGLRHEEAVEALQETLVSFSQEIDANRYDPSRGALMPWILRLAGWKISEQFRHRRPDEAAAGGGGMEFVDEHSLHGEVLQTGAQRLEAALRDLPRHVSVLEYQAFTATVLERRDGHQVAERLGISRNAVYLHKRKALAKLRALLRRAENAFTEEEESGSPAG